MNNFNMLVLYLNIIKMSKPRVTAEMAKQRLPNHIKLDESTYSFTNAKARFIDSEYGDFFALPNDVFRGTEHPSRAEKNRIEKKRLTREQIQARIPDGMLIDFSTFLTVNDKCRFIDSQYGEFWAYPYNVFAGKGHPAGRYIKARATTKNRHGHAYPNQNKVFLEKMLTNQNRRETKFNWLTQEPIVCVGSWESKVVDFLNLHSIKYQWQPRFFDLSNGKRYCPDIFLIEENLWIEIKGRFIGDAEEKWNLFREQIPNSVLWDKNVLKAIGIL